MKKVTFSMIFIFLSFRVFAPNQECCIIVDTEPIFSSSPFLNDLGFKSYADSLAFYESGFNCDTVNVLGYCGKYQFGKAARSEVGYGHITEENFKNDPAIWNEYEQDLAFKNYTQLNVQRLKVIIDQYHGKDFNGITITKSGILAAAHLAGYGNVIKYFNGTGSNTTDINGSSLELYLEKFSGFEI